MRYIFEKCSPIFKKILNILPNNKFYEKSQGSSNDCLKTAFLSKRKTSRSIGQYFQKLFDSHTLIFLAILELAKKFGFLEISFKETKRFAQISTHFSIPHIFHFLDQTIFCKYYAFLIVITKP